MIDRQNFSVSPNSSSEEGRLLVIKSNIMFTLRRAIDVSEFTKLDTAPALQEISDLLDEIILTKSIVLTHSEREQLFGLVWADIWQDKGLSIPAA